MKKIYDVIVIGLGASGLFTMANLSEKFNVLGIDSQHKVGCKMLITGGGRCNLTNEDDIKKLVNSYTNPSFVRLILHCFNNKKTCEYFKTLGLSLKSEDGKIYPKSDCSKDVVDVLVKEIKKKGHLINLQEKVLDVRCHKDAVEVISSNNKYKAKNVVIATGGTTYKQTGSDGKLIEKLFDITPFSAGLSPLYLNEPFFNDISGISTKVKIKYKKKIFHGDMLFAKNMVTGPVILDLSNYIEVGETFSVDFLEEIKGEELKALLKAQALENPKRLVKRVLVEITNLPERLIRCFTHKNNIDDVNMASVKAKELNRIVEDLKGIALQVKGKVSVDKATVSKGGIKLSDIDNKRMNLKKEPRIFVVGEALDVVGNCGGYNLQFAFSSGKKVVDNLNS